MSILSLILTQDSAGSLESLRKSTIVMARSSSTGPVSLAIGFTSSMRGFGASMVPWTCGITGTPGVGRTKVSGGAAGRGAGAGGSGSATTVGARSSGGIGFAVVTGRFGGTASAGAEGAGAAGAAGTAGIGAGGAFRMAFLDFETMLE